MRFVGVVNGERFFVVDVGGGFVAVRRGTNGSEFLCEDASRFDVYVSVFGWL